MTVVLECVVNVSEGRRKVLIDALARSAGRCLLDLHRDRDHNRSVFTLAGPTDDLVDGVRSLAAATVGQLDLRDHSGAHPRIGVLDVVPWVPLAGPLDFATGLRDDFARWAGDALALPCFLYGPANGLPGRPGPERTLPEVRRRAWISLAPDTGPSAPHLSAGATAVGARSVLVAYNLWLVEPDIDLARAIATTMRGPAVRALGLQVGDTVQVSCNLIDPARFGPAAAFDAVAGRTGVARAELVGLVPATVLDPIPERRWPELDLDRSRTIEARLQEAGLDGGSLTQGR